MKRLPLFYILVFKDIKELVMANILETVQKLDGLSKLNQLLEKDEIGKILKNDDDFFTLLAPSNIAFEKIDQDKLTKIVNDKNQTQKLLVRHIVEGKYLLEDIMNMDSLESIDGEELDVDTEDGDIMIEDAMVVKSDMDCSNGVIHVIDRLLLED
jgi:uncharacterized surface protein with fasciclin (FAS1) repeats